MRHLPLASLLSRALPAAAMAADMPVGDPVFGEELFQSLCISCHHDDARGDDRAPDIRGATIPAIKRGTAGMDSMQDFHFEAQEIADIHAYLRQLAD